MMYILILTLMVGIGNGGHSAQGSGGMATAEFYRNGKMILK